MTEFITRVCHAERRYEIIIKTDNEEHYYAAQAYARLLIDHQKPMTNADRIRAMSDEELAKWMAGLTTVGACNDLGIPQREDEECGGQCGVCCLEWLQQPAEDTK